MGRGEVPYFLNVGGFAPVALQLAEQSKILFHAALNAGFIKGEKFEVFAAFEPDAGLGEGDIRFFVAGEGLVGETEAEGEDIGLDGGGALEPPTVVGDGLGEVGFEGAGRADRLMDSPAVPFVGGLFGGRDHEDLAGEAVAVGVEGAPVARLGVGFLHWYFLGFIGARALAVKRGRP